MNRKRMGIYKKWLQIACFSFSAMITNAQVKNQLALGIEGGYRLNEGCFFIDYGLSKKITLRNTYSLSKYQGMGLGLELFYYPVESIHLKPFITASYIRTLGTQFSYGDDANPTVFKVKDANYLTPYIGLKYDDIGEKKVYKNYFSYTLQLGYKISSFVYPGVSYVSGPPSTSKFNKIDKYINNGIVGSIGLLLNISNKKKGT